MLVGYVLISLLPNLSRKGNCIWQPLLKTSVGTKNGYYTLTVSPHCRQQFYQTQPYLDFVLGFSDKKLTNCYLMINVKEVFLVVYWQLDSSGFVPL